MNRLLPRFWWRNWHESRQYMVGADLQEFVPDLVIVFQRRSTDAVWLADICRLRNWPYVIITGKPAPDHWPEDGLRPAMRAVYRSARRCYFPGPDGHALTEEMIGLRLANASIAWPGIDALPDGPIPWPAPEGGRFKLACVAPLVAGEEGQDLLIRVLAKDKWRAREMSVSFYGEGCNRDGLEELAQFLGVTRVSFGGPVPPETLWRDHHALVLASREEGSAEVLVEAQALGRPVIAPANALTRSLVADGETGFLASSAFADGLDETLERAWASRLEWQEMGLRAASRTRSRASETASGPFVRDLLALCGRSPKPL